MDTTSHLPGYDVHLKRGYLYLSWIGLTVWFIGAIFFSPRLRGYWRRLAHGYARARTGIHFAQERETQDASDQHDTQHSDVVSGADACRQAALDKKGAMLDVFLYPDRIERLLKLPTKPVAWQRSSVNGLAHCRSWLTPLTPQKMAREGYPFDLNSAIALTAKQFADKKVERTASRSTSIAKAAYEATSAIKEAGQTSVSEFKTAGPAPKVVKSFKGVVAFAGKDTVRPEGREPYETFTVVLRDPSSGKEETFSGKDMGEIIKRGEVPLGASVLIEMFKCEIASDAIGGKKVTKNEFRITPQ